MIVNERMECFSSLPTIYLFYSFLSAVLAAHNRPNDKGLDFLFQCNNFIPASSIDAEHLIRRALFGHSHTLVSITTQSGMDADAFLKRYSQAGLSIGVENSYKLSEFGMPDKGFYCMQRYFIKICLPSITRKVC